MMEKIISELTVKAETKIVFLVLDGLGGLPDAGGKTELETAHTPNLDALAARGICGLLNPIGAGITPGSGPAHFALFGYDPLENNVGRGLLEAAGIDFPMAEGDLLIRVNFASLNAEGKISDRRAGRIATDINVRICKKIMDGLDAAAVGLEVFFVPVRDHRALLVLRGADLSDFVSETDPQKIGLEPLAPEAIAPEAQDTARALSTLVWQSRKILSDEPQVNIPLLRGYAKYRKYPSMAERYKLRSLAIATYPMYRGIARLLGMNIAQNLANLEDEIAALEGSFGDYDFFFLHIKETDTRGEDGDFAQKVKIIERVDSIIPRVLALKPDVLVVTGDHSTPAAMAGHSWHPVPALLYAAHCRPDLVGNFGERACINGGLGLIPAKDLMALALANAGRLIKFGA